MYDPRKLAVTPGKQYAFAIFMHLMANRGTRYFLFSSGGGLGKK